MEVDERPADNEIGSRQHISDDNKAIKTINDVGIYNM